jgi:hypothetical protein
MGNMKENTEEHDCSTTPPKLRWLSKILLDPTVNDFEVHTHLPEALDFAGATAGSMDPGGG